MSEKRAKQYRKMVYETKIQLICAGYRGGRFDREVKRLFPRCNRRTVIRQLAGK